MKLALPLVAIAAATALGACGAASPQNTPAASSAPATPATTTTTPAPTPTVWSKAEEGQRYLAMIAEPNKAGDRIGKALKEGSLANVQAQCKAMADADDTFTRQLDAGLWDASTRRIIDQLIDERSADRAPLLDCAHAQSLADARIALAQAFVLAHAAQRLRVHLGLPGTPASVTT